MKIKAMPLDRESDTEQRSRRTREWSFPLLLVAAATIFILAYNNSSFYQKDDFRISQSQQKLYFPHVDTSTGPHRRLSSNDSKTGAFANCKGDMKTSRTSNETLPLLVNTIPAHPETGFTIISCRNIHYRAPIPELMNGDYSIVVGVLSGAGGKGPLHRNSIRATWASERKGIYFIVAGPWEAIEEEYNKYRDLIWIEEDEVYEGEESVLPFKTEVFIHIANKYSSGFDYLFKTDDDSYVDVNKLDKYLSKHSYNYWGCCTEDYIRPLRHPSRKWHITFDLYPEDLYPRYCQGAGFAMSKKFVDCITSNLKKFRYNPFEDVSIGLLSERCRVKPVTDYERVIQYRTEDANEKKQLNNVKKDEIFFPPRATMKGKKLLQHRVKNLYDMYAHHKCAKEGC